MTSTDNPTGALTRRQLRELRMTGQAPVIPTDDALEASSTPVPPRREHPVAPLARAVDTVVPPAPEVPAEPTPDRPLTRREARALEKVATASVPVITPEAAAAAAAEAPSFAPPVSASSTSEVPAFAPPVAPEEAPTEPAYGSVASILDAHLPVTQTDAPAPVEVPVAPEPAEAMMAAQTGDDEDGPTLRAGFGAAVLQEPVGDAPSSFDDLLTRDTATSGSSTAGHALIVPDTGFPPLTAPVTSTGEMLITGTFNLPDGLGSQGHAPGVADGKEADAVLIDGELPPASSPTPIAATAAVSQAKTPAEVIRPAEPEKNRLMMALAITAGALAVAVIVVVAVAYFMGFFK